MDRTPPSDRLPLLLAFLAAVLLQIPLLYWVDQQMTAGTPETRQLRRPPMTARFVPRKQKPKPPPQVEKAEGVIVSLPKPDQEMEAPEKAQHLAQHNVKTDRETRARKRSSRRTTRQSNQKVVQKSKVQNRKSKSAKPTRLPRPEDSPRHPTPTERTPLDATGTLARFDELTVKSRPRMVLPATNEATALANIQMLTGDGSAADDALLEVREEAETSVVNAREFRYWHYFQRIKDRVREHWEPQDAKKRNDPTGRIHGMKDRYCVVHVTLDSDGRVRKLKLDRPSGADYLDRSGIQAFRNADQFPNPPTGLIDDSGEVIFQFGFLFEMSDSPTLFWKR